MGLKQISGPQIVLCEGMHDVQFFTHLAAQRGYAPIQATSCGNVVGVAGPHDGISHLTGALNALPGIPGWSGLEAILVVADNDVAGSFAEVQGLINSAADIAPGRRFAAPNAPQEKSGSTPTIVVLMLPWTALHGALDTLCLAAASAKRPALAQMVETFAAAADVDDAHGWPITKQHKMKLRSLLSAAYANDPYIAPAWVWSDGTDLIPLDDPAFNQVADFIQDFPAFLARP